MSRLFSLFLTLALLPRISWACAVCFGAGDNAGVIRAFTWGALLLILFTFAILGTLAVAIYRIEAGRHGRPHLPIGHGTLGLRPGTGRQAAQFDAR